MGLISSACFKAIVMLCLEIKLDILSLIVILRSHVCLSHQIQFYIRLVANECMLGIFSITNENLDIAFSYVINLLQRFDECELVKQSTLIYYSNILKNLTLFRNRIGIRVSSKIIGSILQLIGRLKCAFEYNEILCDLLICMLFILNKNLFYCNLKKFDPLNIIVRAKMNILSWNIMI